MPLPTDPETLRIPAFMRRKNIRARSKKPLILTALDRKKAGILPDGLQKNKPVNKSVKKMFRRAAIQKSIPGRRITEEKSVLVREAESTISVPVRKLKRKTIRSKKSAKPDLSKGTFSPPLLDFFVENRTSAGSKKIRRARMTKQPMTREISMGKMPEPKSKKIGTITHYYEKIQVGVINLRKELSVGDVIQYETDEEPYEQVVESMEIDRRPVFSGSKGDDIGIKLSKKPVLNGAVKKL